MGYFFIESSEIGLESSSFAVLRSSLKEGLNMFLLLELEIPNFLTPGFSLNVSKLDEESIFLGYLLKSLGAQGLVYFLADKISCFSGFF